MIFGAIFCLWEKNEKRPIKLCSWSPAYYDKKLSGNQQYSKQFRTQHKQKLAVNGLPPGRDSKLRDLSLDMNCMHLCEWPEMALATHSSTLAWKTPWTEEGGRLQSMGSLRVGHDWATLISLFTFLHWRSKWQLTPVFWPGEFHGRGNLVGCHLWGRTESDTTDAT